MYICVPCVYMLPKEARQGHCPRTKITDGCKPIM